MALRDTAGEMSSLLAELEDADVVIMVATTEADAAAATIIGAACTVRAIMTADVVCVSGNRTVEECMGLMTDHRVRHLPVVENGHVVGVVSIGATVAGLRPHARVLMVSGDERDVVDLLTALRA